MDSNRLDQLLESMRIPARRHCIGLHRCSIIAFSLALIASIGHIRVFAENIAITNVSVIPMDAERVLSGQSVLIRNGLIEAIGPVDSIAVPDNVTKVKGDGKFLIPGLSDMHPHHLLNVAAQNSRSADILGT